MIRHLFKEDIKMTGEQEKMLNIISYQGNANQNLSKISHPSFYDGFNKTRQIITRVGENVEKLKPIADGNIK